MSESLHHIRPASEAELTELLTSYGVPVEDWKYSGPGSPTYLLRQIEDGEAVLEKHENEKKILRRIKVVRIGIFIGAKSKLVETARSQAGFLPEEKRSNDFAIYKKQILFHPSLVPELPDAAASRGLHEELGLERTAQQLISTGASANLRRPTEFPGLDGVMNTVDYIVRVNLGELSHDSITRRVDGEYVTTYEWQDL